MKRKKSMKRKTSSSRIGYGNPPIHSRWKPGQSGYPNGRPKGTLNFATDLKKTLETPITLNDGGKTKRVSTQKAILLRMREKALKGDSRALDRLLEFARVFSVGSTEAATKIVSADDQAILDAFRAEVLGGAKTDSSKASDEGSGDEDPSDEGPSDKGSSGEDSSDKGSSSEGSSDKGSSDEGSE
jgi:Family of unknown function (DUF5681)